MLLSMTGFSSINIVVPAGSGANLKKSSKKVHEYLPKNAINISMTLKTLNSRYFELNCKIPSILTQLETYLIKEFKKKLHRGNVYFTLSISNSSALSSSVEPALNVIEDYVKSIEKIKKHFNIKDSITINSIINLPNVFEIQETIANDEMISIIISAIEKLTTELIKSRVEEGKVLEKDLKKRIELIKKNIKEIEIEAKRVIEARKKELTKALEIAMAQSREHLTDQSIMTETQSLIIYNQLEKIDIHEEIVRFKSHLENLTNIINADESGFDIQKGKKLDFTIQELFREINTIAAKCNDAKISNTAINIKVELEKSREQAQNIV